MEKLIAIQSELKAPKNQFNSFGKYNYRNAEDILEALKPLLKKHECLLTISDEIVEVGGRIYVKATASIFDGKYTLTASAFAREEEVKKGMDSAQITGSSSSYARKIALSGLFLIDDTKDPDSTNTYDKEPTYVASDDVLPLVDSCKSLNELKNLWAKVSPADKDKYQSLFTTKKELL